MARKATVVRVPERLSAFLYPAVTLVVFLLAWEAASVTELIPKYLLPAPTEIISSLIHDAPLLAHHSIWTLIEAFAGLGIGTALAFVLAVFIDSSRVLSRILDPFLTLSQTVPTIAIAPLLVLWFGSGLLPKIILVVITTFFPITIALVRGFRAVDHDSIDLLKTMGATKLQIFRYAKLPSAAEHFFAGFAISGTYAIVAAVIAEWLGGSVGLGVYMTRVRKAFSYDRMFASIVVISLLSLLVMYLVKCLERRLVPWKAQKTRIGLGRNTFTSVSTHTPATETVTPPTVGTSTPHVAENARPSDTTSSTSLIDAAITSASMNTTEKD